MWQNLSKNPKLARIWANAVLAQLVERRTRNAQAIGSIPIDGSMFV